jgi:hypothetical protein
MHQREVVPIAPPGLIQPIRSLKIYRVSIIKSHVAAGGFNLSLERLITKAYGQSQQSQKSGAHKRYLILKIG